MKKNSYVTPTVVVLSIDSNEVLCASSYTGELEDVRIIRRDYLDDDWYWGEE